MRTLALAGLTARSAAPALPAQARDERLRFPIADAVATVDARSRLDPGVALHARASTRREHGRREPERVRRGRPLEGDPFECGAGTFVGGAALRGEFVNLP